MKEGLFGSQAVRVQNQSRFWTTWEQEISVYCIIHEMVKNDNASDLSVYLVSPLHIPSNPRHSMLEKMSVFILERASQVKLRVTRLC